jgi:cyclomaltodextrinase / maltogenic alpha-amylase / neopullulanase
MNKAAFTHSIASPWCFPISKTQIQIKLRTDKDITQVSLTYGDPHQGRITNGVWAWAGYIEPMICSGQGEHHLYWTLIITPPQGRLKYNFTISDPHETVIFGERCILGPLDEVDNFNYFFYPYLHEQPIYSAPEWVKDTVWYQIFPDRFNSIPTKKHWPLGPVTNSTHYGGNLLGIIDKLPYLSELGISGLYLTPIFESPSTHKYDTTNYFKIDPEFGSLEDLKRLVKKAHELGIRVMLDAVFNHAGLHFEPWNLAKSDPKSPYRNWFYFNDKGYETFSFAKNMPKLNTTNPEVIDYFCKVGQYWIQEADIDGWRLDVANEIAPQFWRAFRTSVRSIKEVYILGEVWHDSNPWLLGDQFDAVMNYFYTRIIMDYFIYKTIPLESFREKVDDFRNRYPQLVLKSQFNLYDSHDTARLLTQANEDKALVKQMLALLLCSEGSPCIYYGTEIAMEGGQDPDCRRLMQFDPDPTNHELYRFIKTFLHLRKIYPALANEGSWEWIPHKTLLMIKRNDLVLLINPSSRLVEIPLNGNILYTEKSSSNCSAYDIKLIQIG